jgi:hypothetical protein
MILYLHCEPPNPRFGGRLLRNCPALKYSIHFQAEIVMQRSGIMLLNDVNAAVNVSSLGI